VLLASGRSEKHSLFTSDIERQSFKSREAINSNIVPPGRSAMSQNTRQRVMRPQNRFRNVMTESASRLKGA